MKWICSYFPTQMKWVKNLFTVSALCAPNNYEVYTDIKLQKKQASSNIGWMIPKGLWRSKTRCLNTLWNYFVLVKTRLLHKKIPLIGLVSKKLNTKLDLFWLDSKYFLGLAAFYYLIKKFIITIFVFRNDIVFLFLQLKCLRKQFLKKREILAFKVNTVHYCQTKPFLEF